MKKILISLTAAALMLLMCVYLASPALAAGTAPIAENLEMYPWVGRCQHMTRMATSFHTR